MSNDRNLRIFCPTHEAAFDTAESQKILCEITGHALSVDFPQSEFWEFCCNCETFAPSRLDKNEKARKNCFACGNETARRYVCENCKTVSHDSNAATKGKSFLINLQKGIEPNCAGCQTTTQNGAFYLHKCREAGADLITRREICPFCLEKTAPVVAAVQTPAPVAAQTGFSNCPQCESSNPATALFCGKCKYQLRSAAALANPGTDVNKTKLLGSLCPNCSTPVPPDSGFCGECGQAVKTSPAPPPPPPKKPVSNQPSLTSFTETGNSAAKTDNSLVKVFGAAIVGGVLLVFIVGLVNSFNKPSQTSVNTNSKNMANVYNPSVNDNRIYSNNSGETSFSAVGNYAYTTTNVLMREGPHVRFPKNGTLFRGTRVKILQVAKRDDGADWWEVHVESEGDYGCDVNNSSRCGKDDYYDADQGWINSKNTEFR